MSIVLLLEKIQNTPDSIEFSEVIATIDQHYDFTPTAFRNGDTINQAGQNSGSCKLFSFAQIQNLTQSQTLACFGAFYRKDVLENPIGTDHQNIRNFIKFGWDGIQFEGNALTQK
ncbi:HopJ type III effector protein [Flectobacillus major]|uniref:HopJ type III effector protein n=1 Tax=Flectobacillus major TaxID=103 RepID=UPI0004273B5C|nr:HopJ type III effector protein [Flectobacillus major]